MLYTVCMQNPVNLLSRIIFKIYRNNNSNYQTVRMSDLRDELYAENFKRDSGDNEIESNNNEKTKLKNPTRRIIIKCKILDTTSDDSEIEHLIANEVLNRNVCSYVLRSFKNEASDRTYTIELIESANILPALEYYNNSLIEDHKNDAIHEDKVIYPCQSDENKIIEIVKESYKEIFLNEEKFPVEILDVQVINETSLNVQAIQTDIQDNDRACHVDIKNEISEEKEADSSTDNEETCKLNSYEIEETNHVRTWPKSLNKQEKDQRNSFIAKENNFLSDKESKDSLIIKDLVLKKYENTLQQFKQRSVRRTQKRHRRSSSFDEKGMNQKPIRPTSLNLKNPRYSEDFFKTPDSGLEASRDLDSFESSNQSLRYSPTAFLKEALGDEYMNITYESEQASSTPKAPSKENIIERSIGSSEISTLISTIDGVESLYSTIDKSKKKKKSSLFKKTSAVRSVSYLTTSDTCIYESIENFQIHPKIEELNTAISVQSVIIAQASKALNLCRQSPVFFGSTPHLEAEKYLLFATYKKIILENQRNRDYEEMEYEQCYGTINVENLRFILNTGNATEIESTGRYYMCLLYSDVALLASNIVVPEKNGHILFRQSFQFKNLTSDFVLYIKIFSMVLENKYKKRLYLSHVKKHSTRKCRKIYDKHQETPEMSSFRLLGTGKVGVSDVCKSHSLYLEKESPNSRISDIFTADIGSSIQITNNLKGFLTIGTTNISWNRRWCVLQGSFVKYWNYPSDEKVTKPIGIYDLSYCVTNKVTSPDKTICCRPRTLMVEIKDAERKNVQYFLQADNSVELEEWKRQLNSVLISLTNWNCLK